MRLIDADKLKETISKYEFTAPNKTYQHGGECVLNFYMPKIIDDAPTIEVEPVRRGKWITNEMTIDSGCTSCSCCRSEYYIGDIQALEGDNNFVMFCPNCGTCMDGGET
ncbi:MAG: hypothetical protein NC093_08955 [Alistipes sp.]|nr:hypothetical protein [Alistipes sp.]